MGSFCGAFTIDKKEAQSHLRPRRSQQNIIDLATIDSDTGAGAKFWKNLERECVEEQCGLEEAIETYEEFGAQAKIQTFSGSQQNFDKKYVNEYVSNYLDDNNMRSTVQANFDKFYTACYPSWAAKDDKANRPGLTQVSFTTSSDDNTSSNSFKITNQKDSFIEVFDECIRRIDINQSVHKFLS